MAPTPARGLTTAPDRPGVRRGAANNSERFRGREPSSGRYYDMYSDTTSTMPLRRNLYVASFVGASLSYVYNVLRSRGRSTSSGGSSSSSSSSGLPTVSSGSSSGRPGDPSPYRRSTHRATHRRLERDGGRPTPPESQTFPVGTPSEGRLVPTRTTRSTYRSIGRRRVIVDPLSACNCANIPTSYVPCMLPTKIATGFPHEFPTFTKP